jgi:hypothetical protein
VWVCNFILFGTFFWRVVLLNASQNPRNDRIYLPDARWTQTTFPCCAYSPPHFFPSILSKDVCCGEDPGRFHDDSGYTQTAVSKSRGISLKELEGSISRTGPLEKEKKGEGMLEKDKASKGRTEGRTDSDIKIRSAELGIWIAFPGWPCWATETSEPNTSTFTYV